MTLGKLELLALQGVSPEVIAQFVDLNKYYVRYTTLGIVVVILISALFLLSWKLLRR